MSNLNRVTMIGNIGTNPEFVAFESGAMLTKFTLAVNRWDKKEKKDITDWFNVETFSKMGEYLKKGYKVAIDGRLITNTYQNKDGVMVKKFIIQAQTVENLTKKTDKDNSEVEVETETESERETETETEMLQEKMMPDELIDDEEIPF